MKKRQLGKSDIEISDLTLGCMSLGTNVQHGKKMIDYALDKGINHLDTADLYNFGENEKIVGEAIKHRRSEVVITTKVGNHFQEGKGDWFWDPSKKYIHEAVRHSLKRLNTDYIDVYMLHGGTLEDPINETIEAFEELKKDGLIRAYGISSVRPNVVREYAIRSSIDVLMTQYSLLDRRPEEAILPITEENQISVVARGPLAKGLLSNKADEVLDKKGHEGYLDYSYNELKSLYYEIEQAIPDSSLQQLAMYYVANHPAITSTVFGAGSLEQLEQNIAVHQSINEIADAAYPILQQLTKASQYEAHR
ncbi:aldo/keto reductase [Oceanobacillus sp. J11TS1]|uniref:aldo/keto reductase n=1 Tax=Oceanobacillus sp. J11TS1 TaxID=2807191 RepID=UPI001B0BE7C0|nr:aldo/keto reductase [Oceanobacillus sp. J11TS1]GIO22538.1 putative oxidoreductase YqkF [Oceanobacillus sp. J11TS1]